MCGVSVVGVRLGELGSGSGGRIRRWLEVVGSVEEQSKYMKNRTN